LRFPELYRKLLSQGVEIMLVPSAFIAITGEAHWESLLRARAIENFSYVVAPNQVGVHANGRATWGHSMIVDPWGEILAMQTEGEGVIYAEIDLDYLADIRRRFPTLEHQRIF
jgi:predicted amidohydrolase